MLLFNACIADFIKGYHDRDNSMTAVCFNGREIRPSLNIALMESIYNKEATEGSVYEKLLRENIKSKGNSTKPV